MEECIICDEKRHDLFSTATETSLSNIRLCSERWGRIGKNINICDRINTLKIVRGTDYHYHRKCYKSFCNTSNLAKAERSHEEELKESMSKKRGRPSTSFVSPKSRKTFDSDLCVFCQDQGREQIHEVCSESMGKKFLEIKNCSPSEDVRARLALLMDAMDAFAQDLKYHSTCLRKETRYLETSKTANNQQTENDDIGVAISIIEIVNIVQLRLTSSDTFPGIDMNVINDAYIKLLKEHEVPVLTSNYKQHLKSRLLEKIPGIDFVKRGPKPEVVVSKKIKDKIVSREYEVSDVDEEMEILSKAAKIIRQEIDSIKDWKYLGSFEDFETPKKLSQLVRWITYGLHTSLHIKREEEAEKMSRNLTQHIVSSYRSNRQVNYESKDGGGFQKDKHTPFTVGLALTSYQANRSRSEVEMLRDMKAAVSYDEVERITTRMALAVMDNVNDSVQGMHIPPFLKQGVRPLFAIDNIDWSSEVGPFHGADLLIAQQELESNPILGGKLKLNLGIKDKSLKENLDVKYFQCDKPSIPKVDHVNYKLYTLKGTDIVYEQMNVIWFLTCSWVLSNVLRDGKWGKDEECEDGEDVADNTGTESQGKQVYEEVKEMGATSTGTKDNEDETYVLENMEEETTNNRDEEDEMGGIYEETKDGSVTTAVSDKNSTEIMTTGSKNKVCTQKKNLQCPTWSTYNSLITKKTPIWNVGICAPLYRRSPTEWPVLLTILMQAQKINCMTMGDDCRPVITLDGDLYNRAVRLKNYKSQWCIRLGSLHTTMAALKCLGRYVEGSGIDIAWQESDIYGPATVRQILDGRHVYRGIEAHTVTLIALHHLFFQTVFSENDRAEITPGIKKIAQSFKSYINEPSKDTEEFQKQINLMHHQLMTNDTFKRMEEWQENGKGIQKFLTNYMNQVMVLLMFIAATRKGDWKLHLAKMEELLSYFHAHDQFNYGRWGTLYVADMLEMQTNDPDLWKFLNEGNFTIAKHNASFTAIDPDHAIEQEHKKMKCKGGFIGITGNESALDKYFIIAPTLSRVVNEFKDYAGIESRQATSLHHELTGGKGTRLIQNAAKLVDAINKQGNPFEESDMFNLMTYAVPPIEVSQNIEQRDKLGREALEKFVTSRMVEKTVGFWDPQKKNNIPYFKNVGPVVKTKVKGQLVAVKQERKLLSRLLVIGKRRPEFEVKDAIGEYEFDSAPPSNFQPDGSMIMLSGKSQLVKLVMDLPIPEDVSQPPADEANSTQTAILIIDAMCVVNMVTKTCEKFTALNFANKFVEMVEDMGAQYDEIRVVFDQYRPGSLKQTTRDKRTKKTAAIHYHVNDSTDIKNIRMFLSHIQTKAELTKYLSQKVLAHYQGKSKKVLVMYDTIIEANCHLANVVSMPQMSEGSHCLEEGDQLVLLNAVDVNHKDENAKVDIFSVDTDVFVLLTGNYPLIPPMTCFVRNNTERISIFESYNKLGIKKAKALVGWYAFKGTDNTGAFAGKGVTSHFKAFMACDTPLLDAFAAFGKSTDVPEWVVNQMERYICLLYKPSGKVTSESIKELRWALFAQNAKEGRQLPPTLGTLIPHTQRAFYMALVWNLSTKPCPSIPPATNFSWERQDGYLVPVLNINVPAPEALLELRQCSCRSSCMTNRCGCHKNSLMCSDACGCGDGCENSEDYNEEIHDHSEDDME